ncbi:MAG: hypothetical protein E7Z93_05280 [Cyanobacteria bacterium SIG32]|nr:hypothetical protein [Cyanobacteria bacterium SIG32]
MNSISFTGQIAGKNKPASQLALTPKGNLYKKTNVCSKLGGAAGAIGAIAYLGAGADDKYICNAIKWGDKLFNKTMLSKCGPMGKVISVLAVSSGIVGVASALGHDLLGFFDRKANQKRAQRADEIAQYKIENAVKRALEDDM